MSAGKGNDAAQAVTDPSGSDALVDLKDQLERARLELELAQLRAQAGAMTAPWWRNGKSVAVLAAIVAATIPVTTAVQGWRSAAQDVELKRLELQLKRTELEMNDRKRTADSDIEGQKTAALIAQQYMEMVQKAKARDTSMELRLLRFLAQPQLQTWANRELLLMEEAEKRKQARDAARRTLAAAEKSGGREVVQQARSDERAATERLMRVESMSDPSVLRAAAYQEVNRAIGRLVGAAPARATRREDRERFWTLYWGDMTKVEDGAVASEVATAGLSPGDIATPVRGLFRESLNTRVLFGEVTRIDSVPREVVAGEVRVPYDYLVLATGASHSYFGKDEWAPFAPGLKRVEDATEVRRRLLTAFELAEATEDETERRSLLNFLVVGGGPTGVELAGAIAELAKFGMEKDFRRFDPSSARVILVQAGARILPTFPEALSSRATRSLTKLGVEVLVNSRVEQIDAAGVTVSGKRIASRTVLWAAGVVASSAAKGLGAEADAAGRLKAGPDLSVAKLPNVFAIGDTASFLAWKGQPVPGLAPAAKQGGQYVARVIRARVLGKRPPPPFVYRHLGSLATIGRKAAVADFGLIRMSGAPAWWLWGLIHVGFLVGLRNRVSVMLDWFWSYLTFRSGTRLITGAPAPAAAMVPRKEKLVMIG